MSTPSLGMLTKEGLNCQDASFYTSKIHSHLQTGVLSLQGPPRLPMGPKASVHAPPLWLICGSQSDLWSRMYSEQSSCINDDLRLHSNVFYTPGATDTELGTASSSLPTLWPLPSFISLLILLGLKTTMEFLNQKRVWQMK